jgi:hypothetical protein
MLIWPTAHLIAQSHNRKRYQSTLGYVTPAEYYADWITQQKLAA